MCVIDVFLRFVEFPSPDDTSKQLLSHLYDPEDELTVKRDDKDETSLDLEDGGSIRDQIGRDYKNYWSVNDRL